jgi:chromosome segregation ATPase
MTEHYLTKQHQYTVLKVVQQMKSQLLSTQMDTDLPQTTTTAGVTNPATVQLQELYDTLNILSGGIETLNDDGQRLDNESLHCQIKLRTLAQDFSQIQLAVEETKSFLEGLKPNQDILRQDSASLKEKIEDMQYVSHDGSFIWKITNVREKMGKQKSVSLSKIEVG